MPKISQNKVDKEIYELILKRLITAFANLKNTREMTDLIEGLFTRTERLMLAKRLAIAALLERGLSYKEISKTLKVSSVTIGFVRNGIMKNTPAYVELIKSLNKLK